MTSTLENITLSKKNIISTIEQMPDEFSAAELVEQILVEEDIKQGIKDIKGGKVYTHEEMKKIIESWFK